VVCPVIRTRDKVHFSDHMKRLAGVAKRIHIDIGDGTFMHAKLVPIRGLWWPEDTQVDIHLMTTDPFRYVDDLLKLEPQMIIVQAEAGGNFLEFAERAHKKGVAVGVALKPETPVALIEPAIKSIDHVLILSGHFSDISGHANTHLLTKVLHLKQLRSGLEIGWEGGVTADNIATLAASGVHVLNVIGSIQRSTDPRATYERLEEAAKALPSSHKRL
jgi:Pentose-5-phosphate-3-epimerase